jgi:hypothetical protein
MKALLPCRRVKLSFVWREAKRSSLRKDNYERQTAESQKAIMLCWSATPPASQAAPAFG